jgi:putative SOS response-associated peptidase YedK
LIPADVFYEWRKTAKPKLPFAIAMKDERPFTFAGSLGKLERSRICGVAAHLHDYHRRA